MKTNCPSPAAPRWLAAVGRAQPARRAVLRTLLFALAMAAIPASSPAQTTATLTTLHSFSGPEGASPEAPLVQGSDGSFYGSTAAGGSSGDGTIFSLTPAGVLTTLHDFGADGGDDTGTDGAGPAAALVQGSDGNFYGSTAAGGSNGGGTIFSLTPAGVLTVLYPSAGATKLVQGSDGNFYGTASGGEFDDGTIFSLTPTGVLTTLHVFSAAGDDEGYVNIDGANPNGLVQGSDGNFYGTAQNGGGFAAGTVFSITPAGVLTTLHDFGADSGDGQIPNALVQGRDGNFYGSTNIGGSNSNGTVFSITPAGVFTTLYNFGAATGNGTNSDGAYPVNALVQGSDGNFYGTTYGGGSNGKGTVFSITPAGVLTSLHSFGATSDGIQPNALVQGSDGNFYGTTYGGGSGGKGTVYKLVVTVGYVRPAFFAGEAALANGVYYLAFPDGNPFGYYSFLSDPRYLYHFDLGYEYVFDAQDGKAGVYFYDFKSSGFFYTSPSFPFPYLYDFSLNSVVYYYPDPNNPGHYNTNGYRFFYVFNTGQIISK